MLRVLACYLTDVSPSEAPYYKIPMHCVMKLTPHAYGTHVETVNLKDESESQDLDHINSH